MIISNMQPVQEAYFGKTKELIECEKVLTKIIKKFKVPFEKVGKRIIDAVAVNKSPENKKLQELIKKQFGFGEVVLHWDGSDEANAYSFSRGFIKLINTDMPKLPVSQADGGYYDKSHNYLCVINVYAGLIDEGLTADELMAVILHEIGHNFQCTPVTNAAVYLDFLWIPINFNEAVNNMSKTTAMGKDIGDNYDKLQALKGAANTPENVAKVNEYIKSIGIDFVKGYFYYKRTVNHIGATVAQFFYTFWKDSAPERYKEMFNEMDEWIIQNKNRIIAQWARYVRWYKKYIKELESDKDRVAWRILGSTIGEILSSVLYGKINAIQTIYDAQTGYAGEVFADSFATAYGYGSSTVSLQTKFAKIRTKHPLFGLNKGNENSTYNQVIFLMYEIMISLMDPHPMNQTRMKNQINKLRRELESPNVPEAAKKSLSADLDRAEKIYNAYLEMPEDQRHLSVIMNFHKFNEMYCGGKFEIRDIVNRVLNLGMSEA